MESILIPSPYDGLVSGSAMTPTAEATSGADANGYLSLITTIIVFSLTFSSIILCVTSEQDEQRTTQNARFRLRIQELEDTVDAIQHEQKEQKVAIDKTKEELEELTRAFMAATQLAMKERIEQKRRLEVCEATLTSHKLRPL